MIDKPAFNLFVSLPQGRKKWLQKKRSLSKNKNAGEFIEVFGAREHNLKNIDIKIPKNQLVVFTGVSGSGKSSLAFDTIYNEGQRRYMESFSAYARQFVGDMERPDVDKITGISPVISIEQKTTNKIHGVQLEPSLRYMIFSGYFLHGLEKLIVITRGRKWLNSVKKRLFSLCLKNFTTKK